MTDHILIVDDDTSVRNSIREFLVIEKFKADTVNSAEEALDFLKNNAVDIVITDILMAGMDGLELTDIIKRDHNTDVIVITGYSGDYSYEEAISKGASDFIFKPVRFEELLLRIGRVLRERRLAKDRAQMLKKLKEMAITDGLTKLYNSRYFYTQIEMEIDRLNRYGHPLSLLLLDIDNFKAYNDTYGHLDGDKILMRLGEIIKKCLRTMDSAYRYGGEEFTILLPETTLDEAINVAKRIQVKLSEEKFLSMTDDKITITLSIGVTEYQHKEDLSAFITRADKAMYLSKDRGKNTISVLSSKEVK
ncbi:MAG: diguanylate cyclase [Proteobacteria bacterium]|nr:diguanylate cyclase [Pseudomonadota bacterium]